MPQIPAEFVQSVLPTGTRSYQTAQATPADFGSQVGQAETQLGQSIGATADMLAKHAEQRQSLLNETNTQDVINKQYEPQFRDLYSKFYQLQGKDAEEAFPKFQQDMTDLRDQTRSGLLNPEQQRMFDTYTSQRQNKELDGMARHAATQTVAWVAQTHHAAQDGLVNMGADKWDNPKALDLAQRSIIEEATNFSNKTGTSPEMRENEIRQYTDKLYSTAILRQSITNPVGAQKSFQSAMADGKISGDMQEKIDAHLKPLVDAQTSRGIAQDVLGGSLATGGDKANNLGNIRASKTSFRGYDSPEDGATDAANLLRKSYSGLTIEQIGAKWAPPSENDTGSWVNNVAKASGLDPRVVPNLNDSDQLQKLLTGIATAEKSPGDLKRFTPEVIQTGVQAALSGKPPATRTAVATLNPPMPDPQQIQRNYGALEDQVKAQAQALRPGDAVYADTAVNHFRQEASIRMQAQKLNDQAQETTMLQALADPNGPKDLASFLSDQARMDAYSQLYRSDPQKIVALQHALDTKAKRDENPVADTENQQLYYTLLGNSKTSPDEFVGKNLMDVYGQMPHAQWQQLVGIQQNINKHDANEASKQVDINKALSELKVDLGAAGYSLTPKTEKDKAKLEQFAGRLGESIDSWRKNNNEKRPGPEDVMSMGRQLLTKGIIAGSGRIWDDKVDQAQALTQGKGDLFRVPVGSIDKNTKAQMSNSWQAAYGSPPDDDTLSRWATASARTDQIPAVDRQQITEAYKTKTGRAPNNGQVAMFYIRNLIQKAKPPAVMPVSVKTSSSVSLDGTEYNF